MIASYPIVKRFNATIALFAKAGYGLNLTHYDYTSGDDQLQDSGSLNKGAYNAGMGINLDFRSNFSVRLAYSYYQAHYPLPGHGTSHNENLLTLGLYYNFN